MSTRGHSLAHYRSPPFPRHLSAGLIIVILLIIGLTAGVIRARIARRRPSS